MHMDEMNKENDDKHYMCNLDTLGASHKRMFRIILLQTRFVQLCKETWQSTKSNSTVGFWKAGAFVLGRGGGSALTQDWKHAYFW